MSVRKADDGSYEVYVSFKDPISNKRVRKHKRGFKTRRAAVAWERSFVAEAESTPDMTLETLWEKYLPYVSTRIKPTTLDTKRRIIEAFVIPVLGQMKIKDIDTQVVHLWQQTLLDAKNKKYGGHLKPSYIATIEGHFSAVLNHAVKFYHLPQNPLSVAGHVQRNDTQEMNFWTQEEFEKFADTLNDKPLYHAAFMMLFWTGLRKGELLALTPEDVMTDPVNGHTYVSITKNFQRVRGKNVVLTPKSKAGIRRVPVPGKAAEELREVISSYRVPSGERIFYFAPTLFGRYIRERHVEAGVKKIRPHDLRHSYVSMLFAQGFSVVDIANLVGQSAKAVTFRYAHMMPNANDAVVNSLDALMDKQRG